MTSLKELVTETDNARRIFEAMKIEAKVSDEEVGEWNDTIDVKIEEATSGIENLEEWLAQREMEAETLSEKIVGPIFLTIDKTNVPPVTKFTNLRELLDVRVRRTVQTLPHSAEGYNRAVAIVTDRFGKQSS